MRTPTAPDALRLFLITSLGLAAYSCGGSPSPGDGGSPGLVVPSKCTNPQPFVVGQDTGFFTCEEGFVHRAEQMECPSLLPRSEEIPSPSSLTSASDECTRDADCGALAYCSVILSDGEPERGCLPSCITDADCGEGYLCVCGEEYGTCAIGGCNTSSDCEGDSLCAGVYYEGSCGSGDYRFQCTPTDLGCDEDYCEWDCRKGADGISCDDNADCGRPFLVESEIRLASAVHRGDWGATKETAPWEDRLLAHERQVVAAYFERVALMEHASIAAFARFSLQLLSLGAPAAWIEGTNRAISDETRHARLAFSLASRFRGSPVGPGALTIEGALSDSSPEAILATTILEGCIGETKAALEARAALEVCKDAEVRAVLEQIAHDETQHAELAWKAVQWMLETWPELRHGAEAAFEAALAAPRVALMDPGVPGFGVLSGAHLGRVHADALERVVRPCAQCLFASLAEPVERSARSQSAPALS